MQSCGKWNAIAVGILNLRCPFWGHFTGKMTALLISSVIFHSRFVTAWPSCLSIGNVLIHWDHIVTADVTVGRQPALYELSYRVIFGYCGQPEWKAGGSIIKLFSDHLTCHPAVLSTLNWTLFFGGFGIFFDTNPLEFEDILTIFEYVFLPPFNILKKLTMSEFGIFNTPSAIDLTIILFHFVILYYNIGPKYTKKK